MSKSVLIQDGGKRMINVLSLFDGMSCGQIALEKAGIEVDKYYAAEIDKYAIKVAKANYPDMIHLGDVREVKADSLPKIDLLIGGSPCQGFSFAGKQLNFDDPRSKLFWEYVRLLKDLKPKYFLLENVRMKKESMDVITEALGVEPIFINSNLVSAQNRQRYYWTNIPMDNLPDDKGVVLADILEDGHVDRDKSHCIDANYFKGGNLKSYFEKHRRQLVFSDDGICHVGDADLKGHDYNRRVYHPDGKGPSLCASSGGNLEPKILQKSRGWNKGGLKAQNGKTPTLSTSSWQHNNHLTYDEGMTWRKLTPLECERLQTVPEGYTDHVSNTQRYKMLGNGWTVDVIKHIFKGVQQ
jgi:DNA-cytosine methyltransferase